MALLQLGQVFRILTPSKVIREPHYGSGSADANALAVDSHAHGESLQGIADALWVVTGTEMSGGGTGHGPHDVYPDGHGVKAARVNEVGKATGETIFFRQSEYFTDTLEEGEVQVVGTATVRQYILALMA